MGDRGQVHIVDDNVWLYTHWGATDLPETVRVALAKKMRWTDSEYLARIIFDTMIGDEQGGELGYGIGTNKHGDVWAVVEVNSENQKVKLIRNDYDDNESIEWEGSFDEFIACDATWKGDDDD